MLRGLHLYVECRGDPSPSLSDTMREYLFDASHRPNQRGAWVLTVGFLLLQVATAYDDLKDVDRSMGIQEFHPDELASALRPMIPPSSLQLREFALVNGLRVVDRPSLNEYLNFSGGDLLLDLARVFARRWGEPGFEQELLEPSSSSARAAFHISSTLTLAPPFGFVEVEQRISPRLRSFYQTI